MATCKECLHYEVCKPMGIAMMNSLKAGALTEGVEHKCYIKCFKPTADVAEVKHGYWKEYFSCGVFHYDCSCCDDGFTVKERCKTVPNYCGICGAKMDAKEGEQSWRIMF